MTERITTYEKFWPFYLGEHSLPATRWFHFVGSTLGVIALVAGLVQGSMMGLPAGLFSGYAFAWFSHFVIEKNRPATFTYPLWSFGSDWRMWALMATGRLDAELARFGITPRVRTAPVSPSNT
jgi:hypothetical protein